MRFRDVFSLVRQSCFRCCLQPPDGVCLMLNPTCRLAEVLTFAAWCWITAMARCEELPNASPRATAGQLVGQLGDVSYQQLERASRQLLRIGLEARAALDDGMRNPDAEIAFRCRRLWDEVRLLAGWQQVSLIVGDSPAARALYDKMFLTDPVFWYELAENPRPLDGLFPERRAQLEQAVSHDLPRQAESRGVRVPLPETRS
jgi:hypothetical protein